MTLPQNPTSTTLDPASMGVIWEEAQEHRGSCHKVWQDQYILYKGVLTNLASSSENSAEICLCEVALSEYIFPGKYFPD